MAFLNFKIKKHTQIDCMVSQTPHFHSLPFDFQKKQSEAIFTTKFGKGCMLSCVQLFATPWTIAHLAPQSVEFSRQEY